MAAFNESVFLANKVKQMNDTGYKGKVNPTTQWTTELVQQELTAWGVTAQANWEACNQTYDPASGIAASAINVSGNQYFDVHQYLMSVANYLNANPNTPGVTTPASGTWTAQDVLTSIQGANSSVWSHYVNNWETYTAFNPSNSFSTSDYIKQVATTLNGTEAEAIAWIKSHGGDPISSLEAGVTPPAVTGSAVVNTATDTSFNQWPVTQTDPTDPTVDPYETPAPKETNIVAGTTAYQAGANDGNVQYNATWVSSGSTLAAKDVIVGSDNGYNTLAIQLGKNWTGFNATKDADGNTAFAVSKIGRVELTNTSKSDLTFNAKNISTETVRYDLVNETAKEKSISLTELSDAVKEINVSNLGVGGAEPKAPSTTNLNFAKATNNGTNDSLTLGVSNVGPKGAGNAYFSSNVTTTNDTANKLIGAIETVTINGRTGNTESNLDISGIVGIKTLNVTGEGTINVNATANGITTYDATNAKGDVTFAASIDNGHFFDSIKFKGTAGKTTTVAVNGEGTARVDEGAWTNIEKVSMNPGFVGKAGTAAASGDQILYVPNYTGLTDMVLNNAQGTLGSGRLAAIRDLTAETFTVTQNKGAASAKIGVNDVTDVGTGTVTNLVYNSNGGTAGTVFAGQISSKATNNVTVNYGGKDSIASGANFDFGSATGTVALNVNNGIQPAGATTNPVTPGTATINAGKATAFTLTTQGAFTATGNLGSATDVTIQAGGSQQASNTVDLKAITLSAANNVTVNGGAQNIVLGSVGAANHEGDINVRAVSCNNLTVGDVTTASGNIAMNLTVDHIVDSNPAVFLGGITAGTDADTWGNVTLNATSHGSVVANTSGQTISGSSLNINLSNVQGTAFGAWPTTGTATVTAGINLSASETINYTGAQGADNITVTKVGSGTSNLSLGAGDDNVTIANTQTVASGEVAQINVNLGGGNDTIAITAQTNSTTATPNGVQLVNVTDSAVGTIKINGNAQFTGVEGTVGATTGTILTLTEQIKTAIEDAGIATDGLLFNNGIAILKDKGIAIVTDNNDDVIILNTNQSQSWTSASIDTTSGVLSFTVPAA